MAGQQGFLSPDQLPLGHRRDMEAAQYVHGSCQGISDLGWGGGHMHHEVAGAQSVKLAELEGDIICQS